MINVTADTTRAGYIGCVERRSLNWMIPKPVRDHFAEVVINRYDSKKQWIGACAAVLMYLEASEEDKKVYERMAVEAGMGDAERVLAKVAPKVSGTPSKPVRGHPSKEQGSDEGNR